MASGNMAGLVELHSGPRPTQTRKLAAGDSAIFDNTVGNDPYFINGIDKAPTEGSILNLGPGPHQLAGENLYVMLQNSGASDIIDSDDTLAVVHLEYVDYEDRGGGRPGRMLGSGIIQGVADRNTTLSLGGLTDDMSADKDVLVPVYAFGPLPAGVVRTYKGRAEINIRDDTA